MKKIFEALGNFFKNMFKTKHKDIPPAAPTVTTTREREQVKPIAPPENVIPRAGEPRLPTISNASLNSPVETKAEQAELEVTVQPKHPGWRVVPRHRLPEATYWPTVAALGMVLFVAGFVMTFILWIVGAALFIIGMVGWMGDLRFEQRHQE